MKQITSKVKINRSATLSVRLNEENTAWFANILKDANKNRKGRKAKPNEIIALLKGKLTEADLELLRKEPVDFAKQEEELRQNYAREYGPISKKAFLGFMMSADYPAFLLRYCRPKSVSVTVTVAESAGAA